jgi:hypothetical protein
MPFFYKKAKRKVAVSDSQSGFNRNLRDPEPEIAEPG